MQSRAHRAYLRADHTGHFYARGINLFREAKIAELAVRGFVGSGSEEAVLHLQVTVDDV